MPSKYLKEFEELNTTCKSIYDLGDFDVLIILKDGTNLTSWDDVEDKCDVIYVSEDLSSYTSLKGKYKFFESLKAIVACGVTDKVTNMKDMFCGCKALADISSLKSWDVSNVRNMDGMFADCRSLADLSPLGLWDVSSVRSLEMMFFHCEGLTDISPLANWNLSALNVSYAGGMFEGCSYSLDFSVIKDVDVEILIDSGWNFTGWRDD